MRRPQVAWIAAALLGLGTLLVIAVAFRTVSTDPRHRTIERIVGALDQRGVRCAGLSIDQSPADEPIAVNAEGPCTVDGRQLRVVIIAATDRATRDRYLRWLSQQGGGGYFAMGDTWGVGSDFEWMARRVHDATGGTVCLLANGVCAPLDR
jgi:hypothetical protein